MAPPQTSSQSLHSNSFPYTSTTAVLAGKPTFIVWGKLRFLLMDAPRDSNLAQYLRVAKHYNVTALVRVCEPTYNVAEVEAAGIQMYDMAYDDGCSPPPEVIERWLALVDEVLIKPSRRSSLSYSNGNGSGSTTTSTPTSRDSSSATIPAIMASPIESQQEQQQQQQQQQQLPPPAIAVHCVAGLGRAPVLVALALIEHGFGDPSAVVEYIRSQRRGAINMRQLNYLEQYKKRGSETCGGCCVM
ncbi:tyrosine phosphatase type iva protein 1 [Nannochloropsis oceanica]